MDIHSIPWVTILTGFGVLFVARWLMFTGVLWCMFRLQGLNYTWPGFLLTTALASIAYLVPIPFVGPALGFGIVYFGLKMVTQAEHTDLKFSIVISNAVVYAASLLLLAATMPDLHALHAKATETTGNGSSVLPDYGGILNHASNTLVKVAGRETPEEVAHAGRSTASSPGILKLKGITMMGKSGLAMIEAGGKTVSVGIKESVTVPGPEGVVRYTCQSISTNEVVLALQGSNPAKTIELKLE